MAGSKQYTNTTVISKTIYFFSDIVKDLSFEDKKKGQRQGLVNWSSSILEDKEFPRGQTLGTDRYQ